MLPAIEFKHVSRHFGHTKALVKAVDDTSFEVQNGEFFTMLGPSGSGKTTCLRMIAGFDLPTSGQVLLFGKDVTHLPPYERDVNTVFQDYALFPHLNVEDNVGYGLMIQKVAKAERQKRVTEMLDMVQLSDYGNRKPAQLSGGQRQRIALARALINRPKVLLLDEPLGALDLKLRQEMQTELKDIQKELGITFIFVTHDQEEAMSMSDRIAVFNKGKIEQIGSPLDLYENPKTPFVANFIGTTNLVEAEKANKLAQKLGQKMSSFAIRPEKIRITETELPTSLNEVQLVGKIHHIIYLGLNTRFIVETEVGNLQVVEQNGYQNQQRFAIGARVFLSWEKAQMNAF